MFISQILRHLQPLLQPLFASRCFSRVSSRDSQVYCQSHSSVTWVSGRQKISSTTPLLPIPMHHPRNCGQTHPIWAGEVALAPSKFRGSGRQRKPWCTSIFWRIELYATWSFVSPFQVQDPPFHRQSRSHICLKQIRCHFLSLLRSWNKTPAASTSGSFPDHPSSEYIFRSNIQANALTDCSLSWWNCLCRSILFKQSWNGTKSQRL